MASDTLKNMNFTLTVRSAPRSGPTSSNAWNDSFNELSTDLSNLSLEWNNKIVPIVAGLPYGNKDTTVDAFTNGLDANNMWVDQNVVSTDTDLTFYNSTKNRPTTVKEALENLYQYVDVQISAVNTSITTTSTSLTTNQKNAIGAHIFDSSQVSSSSSLDGKSENNRLNVIQLAQDLYGSSYQLGNDGNPDLTHHSVKEMVDALLELHNGNWNDDITLDHVGAFTATQADINSSAPGDDSFSGAPSDLEEDLDQIRTRIKTFCGTASWLSTLSSLYIGGANSLEDLLVNTSGTGAKTATNPWGYEYGDIDGMITVLDAIKDFTGQDDYTDSTPSYTSTNYILNNDSLETAIGKLDAQTGSMVSVDATMSGQLAALELFVGQDNNGDDSPSYSGHYAVDGESLELSIHRIDNELFTQSGIQVDFYQQLSALEIFTGQDDNTDSTPSYSSTTVISNGDSLETAIGKIDAAISGGATTFLGLSDTDDTTYSGYSNQIVTVNTIESGLQFGVTGNLSVSNYNITNLALPTEPDHAATKAYVDNVIMGLEWQDSIIDKDLATSPAASVGDRYIIAGTGGSWSAGTIDDIAQYTVSGWIFSTPNEGFACWIDDEDIVYVYNTSWVRLGSLTTHGNLLGLTSDDHTQYLLADGTRPMNGNLNMGGQDIKFADEIQANTTVTASGNITSEATVQAEHVYSTDDITASGEIRSETRIEAGQDIEVTASGYGIVLISPDGTRWRIQIDNQGALNTTIL